MIVHKHIIEIILFALYCMYLSKIYYMEQMVTNVNPILYKATNMPKNEIFYHKLIKVKHSSANTLNVIKY